MKSIGTGIMVCGLMLVAQTVQAQSVLETAINSAVTSQTISQSPKQQPVTSLVLPDLHPLDLATAQSIATENDQDVIVVIGARWCAPCQTMKNYIMPQVAQRGGLNQLQFAYVDFDDQNETAVALMKGTMVPQLVYMHHDSEQWQSLAVIQGQVEAEKVLELINWAQAPPASETESKPTSPTMLPVGE